ncbi:hypothetical protein C2S51_028904 [Perilla frutescens var. frutescens]|nr:hypothetical protein C2S51_028904 [Perilla frutescens var. frutescens]
MAAGEESSVILHGFWPNTYSKRVELALKIKGIPFEYVEEDLRSKSASLLTYNPIYKKVPVLVPNGKPVSESLVILEYIDETWNHQPRLLPDDPYKRSIVRFWAGYIQRLLESCMKLVSSEGEEAVSKAREEMFGKLDVLEEGVKSFLVSGENLNLLDIMIVATLGAFRAQEEILGFKILDPHKHPFIFHWVTALIELPVVKEVMPPHHALVSFLHHLKKIATT